jgi:GNAT superfamily N-acetyltransferase
MTKLEPREHHRVDVLLRDLPINTLFARAVVDGQVEGSVHVDDPVAPRACHIAHPYGMSLLFGTPGSAGFLHALREHLLGGRSKPGGVEWLQAFPQHWDSVLATMFAGRLVRQDGAAGADPATADATAVVQDSRVNFAFDARAYAQLGESLQLPADCAIIDDIERIYASMQGSVVPRVFWPSAAALAAHGAAFGVMRRGELVSVAFASFVVDDFLELGIETLPQARGTGLAVHACRALIDDALRKGFEPVWACRLGNVASFRLAQKVGFVPTRFLPYYRLPLRPPADQPGGSR